MLPEKRHQHRLIVAKLEEILWNKTNIKQIMVFSRIPVLLVRDTVGKHKIRCENEFSMKFCFISASYSMKYELIWGLNHWNIIILPMSFPLFQLSNFQKPNHHRILKSTNIVLNLNFQRVLIFLLSGYTILLRSSSRQKLMLIKIAQKKTKNLRNEKYLNAFCTIYMCTSTLKY